MATEKSGTLEELTKLATDFVTMQKGMWDHAAWTDFVSNLKTKGFDLSGDMQSHLGELLEAMKRFYAAAGSTASLENAMRAVMNDSVVFIKDHKGVWGHSEWEGFLKTMQRNTLTLTEGTSAYLGGVLESIKVFYSLSPALPALPAREPASSSAQKPSAAKKPAAAAKPELALKKKAEPKPAEPKAKAKPAEPREKKPVAEKSDKKDDLTAIGGIGPALAKKLNFAGIVSYAQLAALTDKDIEQLEKSVIKFTGRIERDDWVGQAKKLMQK